MNILINSRGFKLFFVAAALTGFVTGCGEEGASSAQATAADATKAPAQEVKVLTVAATATPHAEILSAVADDLKAQGIDLKVTVFDDYVQPNMVVDRGDIVANYFQHEPYLQSFNKEKGTKLVTVGRIHYEPFGIYPGSSATLESIPENAVIAIPNDTTNEARALLLLQDNGLLKLRDGAGLTATIQDIVENSHNIKFAEIEAAQIARTKNEFNYVVLNGNYALAAGFNVGRDAIAYEKSDSEAAKTYVNIVVVREGNENLPEVKALVKELKSDKVKKFIGEKYNGAVVPFEEGTLDSLVSAAQEKVAEVKDATVDAANKVADKAVEVKDATVAKAVEAKEATVEAANKVADKAVEVKDAAVAKAVEAKEATVEAAGKAADKAVEVKDAAVAKAVEVKDAALNKATELKNAVTGNSEQAEKADK